MTADRFFANAIYDCRELNKSAHFPVCHLERFHENCSIARYSTWGQSGTRPTRVCESFELDARIKFWDATVNHFFTEAVRFTDRHGSLHIY